MKKWIACFNYEESNDSDIEIGEGTTQDYYSSDLDKLIDYVKRYELKWYGTLLTVRINETMYCLEEMGGGPVCVIVWDILISTDIDK